MTKPVQIHDPMLITEFTFKQVTELVPILEKITKKYLDERGKLLKLLETEQLSVSRTYINAQIRINEMKWMTKMNRLGGRTVSELGKVRFTGKSAFYFWKYLDKQVIEVHF